MFNLVLLPGQENEDVKIRYKYHLNKSKTIEVKFILIWGIGTYIPIPIFIYDKTLLCVFDYYTELDGNYLSESVSETPCNSLPDFRTMDFGPIAEGHLHERYLTMVNRNPLTIFVDKIRFSSPECGQDTLSTKLKLIPLKLIDIMSNKVKRDYSDEGKVFNQIYELEEAKDTPQMSQSISESTDFMIPPNSIVVFTVQVDKPILPDDSYCSKFEATLYFSNFQSPDFEIPIAFEVLKGDVTLYPNDLVKFPPAIPGILQKREIYAISSLRKKIYIKRVSTSNPAILTTRILEHQLDSRTNTSIIEITTVGVIQTNSFLKMKNSAIFHHLSHRLNRKYQFESGSRYYNEPKLTYLDILAWQVNEKEWEQKQANHETESTYLLTIDTNAVQNLTIPVQTVVTKPSLLSSDVYDFGNVEVDTDKNGTIVVHNPSPNAIEVSFFIAPQNFLQVIINDLLSDEKLIKWKHICDKSTFFNPYGRKMCEGLIELHSLTSEKKKDVIDYFIRNYFTFITNGDIQDDVLSRFISDQQLFLQQVVQNISDATNSIKPPLKKEISKQEEEMRSVYSSLSKFFSIWPEERKIKTESYEEIVESIKARLNEMIEHAPQSVKDEFRGIFNVGKQDFFLNNGH